MWWLIISVNMALTVEVPGFFSYAHCNAVKQDFVVAYLGSKYNFPGNAPAYCIKRSVDYKPN